MAVTEKQLEQAGKNLKAQQPELPTAIASTVTELLSAKCEKCGLRTKLGVHDWCKRCIDVHNRKKRLSPTAIAKCFISNVGEEYATADLSNVDTEVAKQLLAAKSDIFLHGPIGVGKTWAMAALLKHFLCEGYICRRIDFDSFCSFVRSKMNNHAPETEYQLVDELIRVDKLFIDDLAIRAKTESDFTYVTFFKIFNRRQECRLPTFITTNKNIQRITKSFDGRIASRLGMGTVIEMKGEDRRGVKC